MKRWAIALLVLLVPLMLWAQGGAIYSSFAFGDRFFTHSAATAAMGGTAIAVPLRTRVASQNPALWSSVPYTQMETGYQFRQFLNQQGDRSIAHNNGQVEGFGLILATRNASRWSVALGLRPYSTLNFYTRREQEVPDAVATITTLGTGGLSQLFLGTSLEVLPHLAVGATLSYTFGKLQRTITTTFTGGTYRNSFWVHTDWFSSVGGKGGVYYDGIANWYFGAFVEMLGEAKIRQRQEYGTGRLPDTTLETEIRSPMPYAVGFGVAWQLGHWLFGLDAALEDYRQVQYGGTHPAVAYAQGYRVHLGAQWHIARRHPALNDLESWRYFLGVQWQQLPFHVRGHSIAVMAASFGTQIPINARTFLSVALTGGRRGTLADALVQDWFFTLQVTFTIAERWF